jgi:hypothetical protein
MMFSILMQVALALSPQQAQAYQPPVLWLATRTYHANRPGSESSASGKALIQSRTAAFVTFRRPLTCGFDAGGFIAIDPSAVLGWEVITIPKRVASDNVLLSVTWTRERNHKIEARGSTEILMRPGDSVPLDVTPTGENGTSCEMTSAELRLELDPVNWARLNPSRASTVSTDAWLVRQLPNGHEETEQINIRSALNEEVPFYFTEVKSGDLAMSVFGTITARPNGAGGIALEFSGVRLIRNGTALVGQGSTELKPGQQLMPFNTAQDIVSVEFPLSSQASWKEFATQKLSIRLRSQRIR